MKLKLALIFALAILAVGLSFAGWDHSQGQTRWVDRPTVATCWLRLGHDLIPAQRIQVFNDTIRSYAVGGDSTNHTVNLGYWLTDGTDIWPNPNVSSSLCPTNENGTARAPGEWTDCEWTVNMEGDLVPKE